MSSLNQKLIKLFLFAVVCFVAVRTASAQTNFPAADPRAASAAGTTAPVTTTPGAGASRVENGGSVRPSDTSGDTSRRALARPRTPQRRQMVRGRAPASPGTSATKQVNTSPASVAPVTVVPPPAAPEYLIGQAQVAVRGNQDPVIRLGLGVIKSGTQSSGGLTHSLPI